MRDVPDVEAYLASRRELVDEALARAFPKDAEPGVLFDAMQYSLLGPGKRLRPVLCLAVAETFDVRPEVVVPAAIALEMVHCYSLIHDDLPAMDDDDLRRGRPTNHKVYGEATALLAGDGLLTHAFTVLSRPLPVPAERQLAMIRALGEAAGPFGMVGGQQADLSAEGTSGTESQLEFIHLRKTARLLQAACVMGGLFADLPDAHRSALSKYGEHLGLAFQMMDDWLDVTATTEALGKTAGRDAALDKFTYPRLVGLDATLERANRHVADACRQLEQLDVSADILHGLAHYVVARRH
ncbi:MAG: polyprenyl synthetase family protein [Alicyclobacillus sp.]|nr:polyprenyl synthetase family protein [Alicyclobacillus sp.]